MINQTYEDIRCPMCRQVGKNAVDISPLVGQPDVEEAWIVCECGHDLISVGEYNDSLMEVTE